VCIIEGIDQGNSDDSYEVDYLEGNKTSDFDSSTKPGCGKDHPALVAAQLKTSKGARSDEGKIPPKNEPPVT